MNNFLHPNGRSNNSHRALFYFQSHYSPRKTVCEKMRTSVVAEFNRAQTELDRKTMEASTFRRHLEEHFPRISICPHKEDYCDKCKVLGTDMSRCRFVIRKITESGNSSSEKLQPHKELAALTKPQQEHLQDVKLAKDFYNKMVACYKEQWDRWSAAEGRTSTSHTFTLVLSADYQQAKLIPYWGKSPQLASTYYLTKESHDVFGIVDHRDDSRHVRLFSEVIGHKNTDHTVSLLQEYIEGVKEKHPWLERMLIFMDNATSMNKNRYLFAWAMEQVIRGLVSSIHFCFLVAGHSKLTPDRLFASSSKSYNVSDIFNIVELKDVYTKHCSMSVCNEANIHPWRKYLGQCYTDLPGICLLHKFLGSPISVVIANLVMEDVEQRALATFHSPPRFWKRYVDDTFMVLPCNLVQEFLSHLDSIEACIQFTFEKETEDGKLPFLDVCLCRESDGSITTSVYRKPTHTNQYLPFDSHHPAAHKASVVRTLMSRASDLSSNDVVRVAEEERVVDALKQNGYPLRFIQKHLHCRNLPRPVEDDQRPPRTSLTLPYISGLSETIRRILGPLDIRVAFCPHSTLRRQLVHPKDPVPMDQRTGVVYQIPCSECPKVYVGQSGRTLKHRLSEHRRALQKGDVAASALAEHVWSTGHQVNLSEAKVIDSHPFATTRCLFESWHIQRHLNTLNREKGTLPREYTALLD